MKIKFCAYGPEMAPGAHFSLQNVFMCVRIPIHVCRCVYMCIWVSAHSPCVHPPSFTRYTINFYIFLADQAFAEERENCICIYFLPPKCQVLGCLLFLEWFPLHLIAESLLKTPVRTVNRRVCAPKIFNPEWDDSVSQPVAWGP